MRIAIASDAWSPQVNGVVTTLTETCRGLQELGHEVRMLTPDGRRSIPCPTYPEIRLALFPKGSIRRELDAFQPHCVHVATEGPIGWATRRHCLQRRLPFTSAYHTQFPEYVRARVPIPVAWTAKLLRRYHAPAARTMVPTAGMKQQLEERGFDDVVIWSRGVATDVFSPSPGFEYDLPRPIWINVGRVAVEKNIEAFLSLDLPGSKVVVGDGPDLDRLMARYPNCHFPGYRFGRELAAYLAGADVFVFPSRTDTFGLVMLEAMACGLPIAAFPVTGPIDVVRHGVTGILDDDLARGCRRALEIDRGTCRSHAEERSWLRATRQFVAHLAPRPAPRRAETAPAATDQAAKRL